MDEKDRQILRVLQENADQTTGQVSKKTGIPQTTVHNRIRRLKSEGVIKSYTARLDYEKMGLGICAYILLTVTYIHREGKQVRIDQSELGKKIKQMPEVEEVYVLAGAKDMLLKCRAKSVAQLNQFITKRLRNMEGVDKTETVLVLEEIE